MTISTMTRTSTKLILRMPLTMRSILCSPPIGRTASPMQSLGKDLANDLDELIVQRYVACPGTPVRLASSVWSKRLRDHSRAWTARPGPAVRRCSGERLADSARRRGLSRRRACGRGRGRGEEGEPIGDLGIVADLGLSDFEMGAIIDNLTLSSVEMLVEIADKIKLNPQFRKAVEAAVE